MLADFLMIWHRRRQWLAGALAIATVLMAGCDTEESARRFRDAAATQVELGVQTFMSGLISGAFAAAIPPSDSSTDDGGGDTLEGGAE